MNIAKRCCALIFAVIMVLSMVPMSALAADTTNTTITVDTSKVTLAERNKNNLETLQTVVVPDNVFAVNDAFYVPVIVSNLESFDGYNLQMIYNTNVLRFDGAFTAFTYVNSDGDEVTFAKTQLFGTTPTTTNEGVVMGVADPSGNGQVVTIDYDSKYGYLFFAKFTVVGKTTNADGKETIGIQAKEGSAAIGVGGVANGTTQFVSGTISVETESSGGESGGTTTPSGYEIWYELSGNSINPAVDGDQYVDYDVNDTVTATLYIKNTGTAPVSLQAYDIYLTHDSKLTFDSFTPNSITNAQAVNTVAANGQLSRIQAIGNNTTADASGAITADINIDLPVYNESDATTKIKLGTITFTIKDTTNAPVVYDTPMNITLTRGSAAQGETSTNIGIADYKTDGTTTGNKESKYPSVGGTTKGAEVMTTYDVIYNANTSDSVIGMPEPLTEAKQHNVALTLSGATPTRTGYTFQGWSTASGDNNEVTHPAGSVYSANEKLELFAVWKKDMLTVTFDMNGHGTAIPVQSIEPGQMATKPADPSATGYTFKGWFSDENLANAYDFNTAVNSNITLYAKWEINSYTVSFDMNGHGEALANQTVKYNEYATQPETDPSATGYTFGGWYSDSGCTTTFDFTNTAITTNTIIYAKWTANTVKVTLNENYGDTPNTAEVDETYDSNYAKLTTPTRTGYELAGWNTQKDGKGTTVTTETKVTDANAHELFAQWTPITYTVSFNANSGTGDPPADIPATYDQAFTMPGANGMTNGTQVFAGWAKSSTATEPDYTANQSVTENLADTQGATVELFAVWKQGVFNINYLHMVGEEIVADFTTTSQLVPTYSSTTKLDITDPTATGYTFAGWTSTKLNISTAQKNISIPAGTEGEVDLTAHWTINQYTITFDTDGGSTVEPITKNYGDAITAPADPTKTGYKFVGWDQTIPETMPGKDMTITAQWTINQYTITFDTDNGTAVPSITQDYNTDVTKPANPTKTGYTFAGWDVNGDGEYDGNDVFYSKMPAENKTVKAIWTENTYSITYNKPEGVTFAETVVDKTGVKFTEEVTLPNVTEVTKPGYKLIGFTQTEGGTTVDEGYTPGAKVSGMTEMNNGSVTLYPVFTEATYNLSFAWGEHPVDPEAPVPATVPVTYNSSYPTLPEVTPANGYKFIGWYIGDTKIEAGNTVAITADTTATAKYEAIEYIITFALDGGNDLTGVDYFETNKMKYTIESTTSLPTPTHSNPLYKFVTWTASDVHGSWTETDYDAEVTSLTNMYGNVTLTAQWKETFTYTVEEYKYAADNYVMLRVADDVTADGKVYQFGTGENVTTMYYMNSTDGVNYLVNTGDSGVFYTLISKTYAEKQTNEDGTVKTDENGKELITGELNADGLKLVNAIGGNTVAIDYITGDINGDMKTNIADANIVYQMIVNGGGYYGDLKITERLAADMNRAAEGVHRGSIEDVAAIMAIINP